MSGYFDARPGVYSGQDPRQEAEFADSPRTREQRGKRRQAAAGCRGKQAEDMGAIRETQA